MKKPSPKTKKTYFGVESFLHAPGFFENPKERQPIVLSTRIRLARNISGHPFPGQANPEQKCAILTLCANALDALPQMRGAKLHEIGKLDEHERTVLIESHLISKDLASATSGAVLISRNQSASIMINEEDHLRVQVVRGGFQFKNAWKQAAELDTEIERVLQVAFLPRFGYLTACPTNVGTGLRASAMLHLPALVLAGQMEKVARAVGVEGLAVRGWLGEGSEASGSIFQISNQHTLGPSEEEVIAHLEFWLRNIIEQEENARLRLIGIDGMRLFDQIARACGILQNSMLLTSAEATGALSFMRLGCDLGLLSPAIRASVDRLLIEFQPAHIQAAFGATSSRIRDSYRALLALKTFGGTPPPAFARMLKAIDS
jgi:protein arginine kinase